jgi:hypothetical protein
LWLRSAAGLGVGLVLLVGAGWHAQGSDLKGTDPQTGKTPEPVKVTKPPVKPAVEKNEEDCGCGNHGTTITFLDSPTEAANKAKKDQKLVFVLHVSGNFETPDFT